MCSKPSNTDLVISMTLAEIFLLLVFIVGYGVALKIVYEPRVRMKERLVRLEKENETLENELNQAQTQIADLSRRLELWRNLTGFENAPSHEELLNEVCRGLPKCEKHNVLVHASVVGGQISMEWLTKSPRFWQWLSSSGRPPPTLGVVITDQDSIQEFLNAVRDYYTYARVNGAECRFDYRLTYSSKADYYDGRQLFERYFYISRINRTGSDTK